MPAPTPFVYPVYSVMDIHDGDTMRVMLDLGFDTFRKVDLRLVGLDTPEVTGATKEVGKAVRDWVRDAVHNAKTVTVESTEVDKYGRCLAVVYLGGVSLNKLLIDRGLALPYDGGSRAGTWTSELLAKAAEAARH